MAEKSGLTVKLDLDVSEAISGLKAVQREAKKATQDLRELETYYTENEKRFYVKWNQSNDDDCTDIREVCMSDIPTKYLTKELARRDGIYTSEFTAGTKFEFSGPGQIIVIEK